ncbi:ABC transporter ATP-binding protein [Streptomyces sp. DT9]
MRFRIPKTRTIPPAAASAPGAVITAESVVKVFGSGTADPITAVDRVSLTLEAGSSVALIGPSGSGKSTLLHLLGAIEAADGGSITVGGTEITASGRAELTRYRAGIGFVFQRFHLLPALTARDNVVAPVLPYRSRASALGRAGELLAAVGLAGREDRLPSQLSGGQQQRVAIARALINQPALLLADEPTGNLDSATGTEIIELLLRLNTEQGTTLVLATHDMSIAARCGRVVSMRDGRVLEDRLTTPAPEHQSEHPAGPASSGSRNTASPF